MVILDLRLAMMLGKNERKKYLPKWFNGDLPWYKVKNHQQNKSKLYYEILKGRGVQGWGNFLLCYNSWMRFLQSGPKKPVISLVIPPLIGVT